MDGHVNRIKQELEESRKREIEKESAQVTGSSSTTTKKEAARQRAAELTRGRQDAKDAAIRKR